MQFDRIVPACSFLTGSQSPLDPFEQWALEIKYAKLCNFFVHISMDGFTQGLHQSGGTQRD